MCVLPATCLTRIIMCFAGIWSRELVMDSMGVY